MGKAGELRLVEQLVAHPAIGAEGGPSPTFRPMRSGSACRERFNATRSWPPRTIRAPRSRAARCRVALHAVVDSADDHAGPEDARPLPGYRAPGRRRHFQPTILGLPVVKRRFRHAMLANQVSRLRACLGFPQRTDNLLWREIRGSRQIRSIRIDLTSTQWSRTIRNRRVTKADLLNAAESRARAIDPGTNLKQPEQNGGSKMPVAVRMGARQSIL